MRRSLDSARTPISKTPDERSLKQGVVECLSLIIALAFLAAPLDAVQMRVREGQLVRLKLHNILTTENVEKGDMIDFDVSEDVVVGNRTVIAKGAVARGTVIRVKGAGKRRAKDAFVTFRFVSVRAVDSQEIPLRVLSSRSKKKEAKESEIEESSPIPGLAERMIGADKGKEYAAYTDTAAVVNAAETPPAAPVASASSAPGQPAATPPAAAPPSPAALADVGVEQANVDFKSVPVGADIFIDGSFRGNTPLNLKVAPGRHHIEIRFGTYQPWTRAMWVEPGSHPSIRATLERP